MNPALPVLILITLGGFAVLRRQRRDWGRAWLWIGLAGMALLAPAVIRPDGIPSPASTLARWPPWQGVADPAAGNPNLRDVSHQIQPWLIHLRRELRSGHFPFWNPHQFAGAPFWANGQSAPLFPLHLVFVVSPLQMGLVLLPWLKFLLAGLGAFGLARALGVESPGAVVTALVYPLSGMMVCFLSFPMGNALALAPWVLWAVERIARGGSAVPLAAAAGLQMLAGHPETCLHTGLLSALYLGLRGPGEEVSWWRMVSRFASGWLVGAGIAAVHLLPLALHLPETTKWAGHESIRPPLALVLREMLRVVLPGLYGHPVKGTAWGPVDYASTAVYAGAVALPLAAAGFARARREGRREGPWDRRWDRRWLGVGGVFLFGVLVAYHLPGLWDLVASLPIYSRVLHHRLLFAVELTLALGLGAGWQCWQEGKGRAAMFAGGGLAMFLLAAAWGLFAQEWADRELLLGRAGRSLGILGLTGLLLLPWSAGWRRRARWVLPLVLAVDLWAAHGAILPGLSMGRFYPETPAVEFLQDRPGRVAGIGGALHPNAAMVYGLYDLRGDDPIKSLRFEEVYRRLTPSSPVYFRPVEHWDRSEVLDALGVRWVMGDGRSNVPVASPPVSGWRLAYEGSDARVWERPGAQPLVRREPAGGGVRVVERMPGRWVIETEGIEIEAGASDRPETHRLVVAEMWDAGWSARLDGDAVAVTPMEFHLLSVDLPPGDHRVELRYRPPGLLAGFVLTLSTLLGLGLWSGRDLRRRPADLG